MAPLCHKQGQTVLGRGGQTLRTLQVLSAASCQGKWSQSSKTVCVEEDAAPSPELPWGSCTTHSCRQGARSPNKGLLQDWGVGDKPAAANSPREAAGRREAQAGPLVPRCSVAAFSWAPGSAETASQAPVPHCSKKSGSSNVIANA